MTRLIDAYDVALFDLDGVIYLGPRAVAGAVEGVAGLRASGVRACFVTNNAARPAQTVADHLVSLGLPATVEDLVTSAQAAVGLMRRELPAGARVLVAGTQNLVDHMLEAGFQVVDTAADEPDAVVQGYDPQMTWPRLDEAAYSVQNGARWYACNTDSTRPTERGLVPGAGVAVYAVQVTTRATPIVTGKPFRPLLEEALRRTAARNPLFVGDRLDTDIAGANTVGIDSVLVFTGVHGKHDLVAAEPALRPTHIAADIPALLRPARVARADADGFRCGAAHVTAPGGVARIDGDLATLDAQLDALWALAHLVWAGGVVDYETALGDLNAVH
nr:HAD-IIA family hydrolase [Propionibacterium sp.]